MLTWLRDKLLGDPSVKPKEPVPAVEVVAAPPPASMPAPEPVESQITDSITAGKPKRKYTKKTTTAKKAEQ